MSTPLIVVTTLTAYFLVLLLTARHAARRLGSEGGSNAAFFRARRRSPWWMVAVGMVGTSISGVTFISVPGWAATTGMTYLQMCMGFIAGYVMVAFILLPLYYRLRLTSIYQYLAARFGPRTHATGALFFVVSKLTGAAVRLYLICMVLSEIVAAPLLGGGLFPFLLTTLCVLGLIWLYTHRGGVQTVVRTDFVQTFAFLIAAGAILYIAARSMDLDWGATWRLIAHSPMSRVWEWDAASPQAFWRQFVSGAFIVIVMTGLDQDMMQKNLTCRTLRDAQKDMCLYGLAFLPVNALFLALGVLLYTFCQQGGLTPPASGDELLPWLVASGHLARWVIIPFTLGLTAAAFSSADSALTSLTTTVCVDLLGMREGADEGHAARRRRRRVHVGVTAVFVGFIIVFRLVGSDNVLNAIYVMASYTYGPLLGLYAYGLFTRRRVSDRLVPPVCIAAPLLCALLDHYAPLWWGYRFGYELLLLNGLLTALGLWLTAPARSAARG